MVNLDSVENIKDIDKQNVYGSALSFADQCLHAWKDANKVVVPESYKDIDNVVMCGMGGSGLGARVIESVYGKSLRFPYQRVNDYFIPAYVNERSLVICSSYSGETEETLQNAKQAIEKQAKWMAIGSGNTLIQMAQDNNVPFYKIDAKYNPSNQPRMAVGYNIIGQIVLASKAGIFDISKEDIDSVVKEMQLIVSKNNLQVIKKDNESKTLVDLIKDKIIILISSDPLVGSAHVINNQFNENSKNLTFDYTIPELNHHLMEGLKHPEMNKDNIFVIFLDSDIYDAKIKKRFEITKEVIKKNNIQYYSVTMQSNDKLSQAFEAIQFGAFLNFYLSILYEQDPAPIPWVDYFKEQLANS